MNWFKPPVNMCFTDRSKAVTLTFIDKHIKMRVICVYVVCLFYVSCFLVICTCASKQGITVKYLTPGLVPASSPCIIEICIHF